MSNYDERTLAAYHEAGHAIAATLRGGSELRSLTIDEQNHGHGLTLCRSKPADAPFITWAGLWAEARLTWPMLALDGLDDEDDDGLTFQDHINGVWLCQPGDAAVLRRYEAEAVVPDLLPATYRVWHHELDREWPAISALAKEVLG